ncbi:MAG TPA: hypothetical protein VGJ20_11290 [Xanthobacteraceae bacterium]|jgi:hypothetical protein
MNSEDSKERHQLNIERFRQLGQTITALQAIYDIPDDEDEDEAPLKTEEAWHAIAVVRDLINQQDELLDEILAVDPGFEETI